MITGYVLNNLFFDTHSVVKQIYDLIIRDEYANKKVGKYFIQEDNLFCIVSEFITKSSEDVFAETHKDYVDIHYISRGSEEIGVSIVPDIDSFREKNLKQEADNYFFDVLENEFYIQLNEGMFAFFENADIHRPGIFKYHTPQSNSSPQLVRKLVFKIKKTLLQL